MNNINSPFSKNKFASNEISLLSLIKSNTTTPSPNKNENNNNNNNNEVNTTLISKINYLEQQLELNKKEHEEVNTSLIAEVKKLQAKCNDLTFELIMKGVTVPKFSSDKDVSRNKSTKDDGLSKRRRKGMSDEDDEEGNNNHNEERIQQEHRNIWSKNVALESENTGLRSAFADSQTIQQQLKSQIDNLNEKLQESIKNEKKLKDRINELENQIIHSSPSLKNKLNITNNSNNNNNSMYHSMIESRRFEALEAENRALRESLLLMKRPFNISNDTDSTPRKIVFPLSPISLNNLNNNNNKNENNEKSMEDLNSALSKLQPPKFNLNHGEKNRAYPSRAWSGKRKKNANQSLTFDSDEDDSDNEGDNEKRMDLPKTTTSNNNNNNNNTFSPFNFKSGLDKVNSTAPSNSTKPSSDNIDMSAH